MECPACHTDNRPGQKFCGSCGRSLENECPACEAANPLSFNFCGRCGHSLATSGTVTLRRSGLIAAIDQEAAALLGQSQEDMTGKPFSLFVTREDMPIFFVHWNELRSSCERQTTELALKHKKGKKIYVMVQWTFDERSAAQSQLFLLNLNPAGSHRSAMDQLQHQQDLLDLIYSLADSLHSVSHRHLDEAIVKGLKKICLFSKADHGFIYSINRFRKSLEISHQWLQPSAPVTKASTRPVPLTAIKHNLAQLRQEQGLIVDDVSKLSEGQRNELQAAFQASQGALMCQLVYSRNHPVAIIGIARNEVDDEWAPDCASLIKLFGHLVRGCLSLGPAEKQATSPAAVANNQSGRSSASPTVKEDKAVPSQTGQPVPAEKVLRQPEKAFPGKSTPVKVKPLPDLGRPMQLEKMGSVRPIERQRVYVREDGLVLLTCPYCGLRESVTTARFERLGNAVTVLCTCQKRFAAILEKRRSVRKAVQLEGYFTIAGEYGPNDTKGSIWGPMVVKNLSKSGLRFFSQRVDLIRLGDLLMVRFNLDNSNNALIHKKVEVISIQKDRVGCRFYEADEYDITLGFYFI
jgi:hypothetical protein